jgi:hypothetical protein
MPQDDEGQLEEGQLEEGQQQQQEEEPPAWTPPASQEEFDRIINDRLKRERSKFRDYDTLKTKAQQFDSLKATTETEHEKAMEDARLEAASEALQVTIPKLVRAEFRAAAKGLLDKDQLAALLEDVDLLRYVDDDGDPDMEKIERKIKAVAPKQPPPSFGQGPRGNTPKGSNMNDVIRNMAGVKN